MNRGNGRLVAYGFACALVMVVAAPAGAVEVIEDGLYQQTEGIRDINSGWDSALVVAGRYELSGDAQLLITGIMSVRGETDAAVFVQTGGAVHLKTPSTTENHYATLYVGSTDYTENARSFSGTGDYIISGGSLTAGRLAIGNWGPTGTFSIADSSAQVTVQQLYLIGGNLDAVPGSRIRMLPSPTTNLPHFLLHSTTKAAGLANITFDFEGDGSERHIWFQITGKDFGADESGFLDNSAVGAFEIGLEQQVELVIRHSPWSAAYEALYVDSIILGEGSILNLSGQKVYYRNFTNLGGEVLLNGGTFQQVPEPASVIMLGLGAVAMLRRRQIAH